MIRLANKSDATRISELWLAMIDYHQVFDGDMFKASDRGAEHYESNILNRLDDPLTRVLVAQEDGIVIGYVLGMVVEITPQMFVPVRSGFLADIFVLEDYRRQGIGRELVERLILWFQSYNIGYFEWHVSHKNVDAVAFWESIGARTTMRRMRANIIGDDS